MRATNLYAPTLREMPADAELISHKLTLLNKKHIDLILL